MWVFMLACRPVGEEFDLALCGLLAGILLLGLLGVGLLESCDANSEGSSDVSLCARAEHCESAISSLPVPGLSVSCGTSCFMGGGVVRQGRGGFCFAFEFAAAAICVAALAVALADALAVDSWSSC